MSDKKWLSIVDAAMKDAALPLTPLREVEQLTWTLKGHLKNSQISYLRVGAILVRVRDRKLYKEYKNPKHPDMESYADVRLHLGKTSLYRYMHVYDWVFASHKEWLQPHPAGFIPDLSAAADLIWIEKDLARTNLDPKTRAALEELRKKALEGRLRKGEIDPYRRAHHAGDLGLKRILARLRLIRTRAAELATMPRDAIADLDAAIESVTHALPIRRIHRSKVGGKRAHRKVRARNKVK